jgi:two-component sensor histidine kinase
MGRIEPSTESEPESPWRRLVARNARQKIQNHVLTSNWNSALARESALRKENSNLLELQRARAVEFQHRLFNGLQLVATMLLLQCRTATAATAAQLSIAAGRINAFGCVHRRLYLVDCVDRVEITQHLQDLCDDLSALLFYDRVEQTIVVQGPNCEIPTTLAIPIGFIVNELITNSAKRAHSNITVRFETLPPVSHSITVLDDGPGLSGVRSGGQQGSGHAHRVGVGQGNWWRIAFPDRRKWSRHARDGHVQLWKPGDSFEPLTGR